ncbi:MAG: hypothetical protein ACREPE_12700, partial [Lysobacter sp.]
MIKDNQVLDNNLKNFAPASSVASTVPEGLGVLVVGADEVRLQGNDLRDNQSAGFMAVDTLTFGLADDPKLAPYPDRLQVLDNSGDDNGERPS